MRLNLLAFLLAALAPTLALAAQDLSTPINTICPVDGMVVDRQLDPIVISDTTGKRTELVPVGVCSHQSCAEAVTAHPEWYLEASRANRIAKTDRPGSIDSDRPAYVGGSSGSSGASSAGSSVDAGGQAVKTEPNQGKSAVKRPIEYSQGRAGAIKFKREMDEGQGGGDRWKSRDRESSPDWKR
jgi:hypothetical protein